MSFLEELQKKPKHVKAQVAFGTALSVTLAITLVWGLTLSSRLGDAPPETVEQQASAGAASGSTSFVEDSKDVFSNLFSTVRGALGTGTVEDGAVSGTSPDADTLDLEEAQRRGRETEEAGGTPTAATGTATGSPQEGESDHDDTGAAPEGRQAETTAESAATGDDTSSERPRPRTILIATTTSSSGDESVE